MKNKIYQIQISLKNFKPKIWRRIQVSSSISVSDFHKIIQTTMGWTNSHLHQFIKGRSYYSIKLEEDDFWDDGNNSDYSNMVVSDLLAIEKEKIIYEYDFGDGWQHELLLEKILPVDGAVKYPVCLKGKMNCPPEDSGGVWGYEDLIEVLSQPDHEEYEFRLEWVGEDFDPQSFDTKEINDSLQEKDYGCLDIW